MRLGHSLLAYAACFLLGVLCTLMMHEFFDTSPEDDLESIRQSSAQFQAICESTVPGSFLARFLIETNDSVLGNTCEDGVCILSIEGGYGLFYDVCTVDYDESSGQIIKTLWLHGDQ